MLDANDFEETETLKNGVTVKVRAIRPADKAGITEAFGRLDPESVYTRFFHAKGVVQFEATVLPQNKAMLAVFARSGFPMNLIQTEGDIHVMLSLIDRLECEQSEQHDDTSPIG